MSHHNIDRDHLRGYSKRNKCVYCFFKSKDKPDMEWHMMNFHPNEWRKRIDFQIEDFGIQRNGYLTH